MVPKFAFRAPYVGPGAKALYASMCTNASSDGLLWRSLTKLAEEFNVSRRQIQRWLTELEQAGFVVRMGWQGKINRFLVIRDESGVPWGKQQALKKIVSRRLKAANNRRAMSGKSPKETKTPTSRNSDTQVTSSATPMSHKHDLSNKTNLTGPIARQGTTNTPSCSQNVETWGLKRLSFNQRAAEVQNALNALAVSVGWHEVAEMSPDNIASAIAQTYGLHLTKIEIRLYLMPNI